VVALDLSLSALARAGDIDRRCSRGSRPRCSLVLGSGFALPLADATIDLALDAGCLHSIGRASRPRYAGELARAVTPGGWLLVRGAGRDHEEEGLVSVASRECGRWLGGWFEEVWSLELPLEAREGALDAVAVLFRRITGAAR
jgi:SAM-dependent methyltransferase